MNRLRLPQRLHGGGIRSQEHLRPAAFSAMICRTMPRMIDSMATTGESRKGFMPPLVSILGAGSFDDDMGARWFQHLLAANTRAGREFEDAWSSMQREVGEPMPGSTLASPVSEAGHHTYRVQGSLTTAREKCGFQKLDVSIRSLPREDVRRLAWLNVDRFSAAWVSTCPSGDTWLSDAEFVEIACRYFGLPSPSCGPLVGQAIVGTQWAYGPSRAEAPQLRPCPRTCIW